MHSVWAKEPSQAPKGLLTILEKQTFSLTKVILNKFLEPKQNKSKIWEKLSDLYL